MSGWIDKRLEGWVGELIHRRSTILQPISLFPTLPLAFHCLPYTQWRDPGNKAIVNGLELFIWQIKLE